MSGYLDREYVPFTSEEIHFVHARSRMMAVRRALAYAEDAEAMIEALELLDPSEDNEEQ